jgi:8-oxo-dGTP diphosphatase
MKCRVYELDTLLDYKYVVVLSWYQNKILLSRHAQRDTWETQGGHIENGETPLDAARRELYEESGATRYAIRPLCDYWVGDGASWANGMVFYAGIEELGPIPSSEMQEVATFDALPPNLTYPEITPRLFEYVRVHFGDAGSQRV